MTLLASASLVATARAQVGFAVHAEVGAAAMLSPHQREVMGYDNGFSGAVRPELRFGDSFGLELNAGIMVFPATRGTGQLALFGGGFRVEPMFGDVGRLVLDAHANYANTGDLSRFSFDFGAAFEFQVSDVFGLGPFIRYTHVLDSGNVDGGDAMILTYGLTVAFGPAHHALVDTDGDGVPNALDMCPTIAEGPSPDPNRVGCPLVDTDGDGVFDDVDVCITVPAGPTPDPERRGCPLADTDGDGINDRNDLCPREAQGPHPDPQRAGCPLSDEDADGVYDADDACPTTPAGAHPDPTRRGCPDGDDDGDGVLNSADRCPTEHMSFNPDPARPGCPLADRDHDAVPDAVDACPDVPGAPSSNPRRNGCPGLVTVYLDRINIERPLYFATGRDTILHRSDDVLLALADALRLVPAIHKVSIEGHTDDVGTNADNQTLSERRAHSVMQWLIDHHIEASRLQSRAFGETRPVATGVSASAREENRQVDVRVIDPAPANMAAGTR